MRYEFKTKGIIIYESSLIFDKLYLVINVHVVYNYNSANYLPNILVSIIFFTTTLSQVRVGRGLAQA
mgnify:FL=1